MDKVERLINELEKLKKQVMELEKELNSYQKNCHHHFIEGVAYKTCQICHYSVSTYY